MSSQQSNVVQELAELNVALAVDVLQAGNAITVKHSDTERRNFVRAMFAQIEGMNYKMKQMILRKRDLGQGSLSESESILLQEISYDLDRTGEIRSQTKYLQLLPNRRFTFTVFAKAFSSKYKLDVSSSGWENFRTAMEIRNRITHPKNSSELIIPDTEIDKILEGYRWYTASLRMLLESCSTDNQ